MKSISITIIRLLVVILALTTWSCKGDNHSLQESL